MTILSLPTMAMSPLIVSLKYDVANLKLYEVRTIPPSRAILDIRVTYPRRTFTVEWDAILVQRTYNFRLAKLILFCMHRQDERKLCMITAEIFRLSLRFN